MAALPASSAIVGVGPPLLRSGPSSGLATGMPLPQPLSPYWRLWPPSPMAPAQSDAVPLMMLVVSVIAAVGVNGSKMLTPIALPGRP